MLLWLDQPPQSLMPLPIRYWLFHSHKRLVILHNPHIQPDCSLTPTYSQPHTAALLHLSDAYATQHSMSLHV